MGHGLWMFPWPALGLFTWVVISSSSQKQGWLHKLWTSPLCNTMSQRRETSFLHGSPLRTRTFPAQQCSAYLPCEISVWLINPHPRTKPCTEECYELAQPGVLWPRPGKGQRSEITSVDFSSPFLVQLRSSPCTHGYSTVQGVTETAPTPLGDSCHGQPCFLAHCIDLQLRLIGPWVFWSGDLQSVGRTMQRKMNWAGLLLWTFEEEIIRLVKKKNDWSTNRWIDKDGVVHTDDGILLSNKTEQNNTICSNMDGTRDHHTKWSKSERERQMLHDMVYMWNLDTNELIYKTGTNSQT